VMKSIVMDVYLHSYICFLGLLPNYLSTVANLHVTFKFPYHEKKNRIMASTFPLIFD
jgi:hypothetical protein